MNPDNMKKIQRALRSTKEKKGEEASETERGILTREVSKTAKRGNVDCAVWGH